MSRMTQIRGSLPTRRLRRANRLAALAATVDLDGYAEFSCISDPYGVNRFSLKNQHTEHAMASGSPFSHTGIVAIENGSHVVYDCAMTQPTD